MRGERFSVEKESNLESSVHSSLKFQLCSRYLKSKYSGLYPVTNFGKKKKRMDCITENVKNCFNMQLDSAP